MGETTFGGKIYCFDKDGNEVPAPLIRRTVSLPPGFPKIVCLCGSTKFKQAFIEANFRETMAGNIVLSVGLYGHADGEVYSPTEAEKLALDELHKRKIDLADSVFVINCKRPLCPMCSSWVDKKDTNCICHVIPRMTPYIGDSTRSEIAYAIEHGKPVRYLEQE